MRKLYSVPHWADPNAVFYNKSLLHQVGAKDPWDDLKGDWTLTQMVELARAATRDRDGDGKPDTWGLQWSCNHPSHVGMLAWTLGGDVADFQAQRYTLDSPTSIEAHRQLQQWLTRDRILLPLAEAEGCARRPGWSRFRPAGWRSRCAPSRTWGATSRRSATRSSGTSFTSPKPPTGIPAWRWRPGTDGWQRRARRTLIERGKC